MGHGRLFGRLALVSFLLACGSLTAVGGAVIARFLFHMRIMWDTTLASVCMAVPWLLLAALLAIIQWMLDGRRHDAGEPGRTSHRRH
ncbi:hypothetical protein [Bifidobacterium sp. SO1]|uniref:hypothetical protein n=1 Tax=Bifidobacterium sp. SO1 TaxID=2809029 RepID=UPI001BDC9DBF|nr:hypothetical protein [Bifidobacterium sp. SO1]MBT1161685.1 hypothetical protein [Bifidobacterium sp. SO1]